MVNHTGLSPLSPIKYLGPNVYLAVVVTRNREPTGADYRQPETGKLYPFNTFWLVGKNPTTGIQGDMWYLSKIVANVAFWIKLSAGGAGPLINIQVQAPIAPGVNPVTPTVTGLITFNGAVVTNAGVPVQTITRALNTLNLEVQYAGSAAVSTPILSGLAHFNNTEFTVDATGFVSLSAGAGTLTSLTGDDALAATPTLGNINLVGAIVASGTHALRPLFFRRSATSTETLDLQLSIASATSVFTNVGVSSFDSVSFTVDTNGFVKAKSGNQPGVSNLGISYAAPTFTVQGANGIALSASNPAYVTLQDGTTSGRLITVAVTANQTFTDGAGGNIDTWQAGIPPTTGAGDQSNWSQDIPFFLYAVLGTANDIAFMISRNPCAKISPVAASISKTGTILNTGQNDFFSLLGGTIANYASRPCLVIGSFRMREVIVASNVRFTAQTLVNTDGIGLYNDATIFIMPTGVNGAAASTYFAVAGTTQPQFTAATSAVQYTIKRDGRIFVEFIMNTLTVVGTGTGPLTPVMPYKLVGTGVNAVIGQWLEAATNTQRLVMATQNNNTAFLSSLFTDGTVGTTNFLSNTLQAGDSITFRQNYQAYGN